MANVKSKKDRKPLWKKLLTALLIVVLILAGGLGLYAYDNLSWQSRLMDHVWQAGFEEKQAELPNGTVLNYGVGGPEDGTPLFLIHGQQVAWEDYARVLPTLAKTWRVYAVDCHGHGDSTHDPARYTCQAMTEDFVWFIENVIGKPCVLSGHSSGGILASAIAATAPEDALGLLIEDSPFHCFRPADMEQRRAFVWSGGFQIGHDFLNQTAESSYIAYYFEHNAIWRLFGDGMVAALADSARSQAAAQPEKPFQVWYMPASMMNALYYTHQYDLLFGETFYNDTWFAGMEEDAMLQSILCPTVYLHAKESYMMDGIMTCATPEKDAEAVAALIPNCEKIELPASDHDIHFVYPDAFLNGLDALSHKL